MKGKWELGAHLQVNKRLFGVRLIFAEALQYHGIRALAKEFDFAIWTPNDRRHALPSRVELADIDDLVLQGPPVNVHKD